MKVYYDPRYVAATTDFDTTRKAARVAEREQIVFGWARRREIPIAFALAGGYASSELDDAGIADLHAHTIACASVVA